MNMAARWNGDDAAWQETATVTSVEGAEYVVESASGARRAKRAAGCLLVPARGDVVLTASSQRGVWVLTVLERDEREEARLRVEGDVRVELPSGSLAVSAREGVELASGGAMAMVAPAVSVHAPEGTLSIERLSLLGGAVEVDVAKVRVAAGAIDQTVERVTQRVKRVMRFVEDFEELRAGRIDYVAKTLLSLHGRGSAVTADELVKVDAAQVHVG